MGISPVALAGRVSRGDGTLALRDYKRISSRANAPEMEHAEEKLSAGTESENAGIRALREQNPLRDE